MGAGLTGVTTTPSTLTTLNQDDLVQFMVNQWAALIGQQPVLSDSDPALALFRADALQGEYLTALALAIVAAARLSTSTGGDVDTFVADYGLTRLPAIAAQGTVTLGALTAPSQSVAIAAGTVIQVQGGAIQYQLIADTTQAAWNASLNAYVLPVGQTSISATAQALIGGSAYNAPANALTQFATPVGGVDTVTNPGAIINGLDAESDAALKARFALFFPSLSQGTDAAVQYAAMSVKQGLSLKVLSNVNQNGAAQNGFFTVVVADNGAAPSAALLAQLTTQILAVRALTVNFAAVAPSFVTVDYAMTLELVANPTEPTDTIVSNVETAVSAYINGLGLGTAAVPLLKVGQVAIDADPNVASITPGTLTLNGAAADLALTQFQMAQAGTGTVST